MRAGAGDDQEPDRRLQMMGMASGGAKKTALTVRGLAYPYERQLDYRTSGLRGMRIAGLLLRRGDRTRAERTYRDALRYLVYGFLIDRCANRDLFAIAHNVGRIIEHEFGCPMEYDERSDAYFSTCPIDGLHSRMGSSAAFATASDCSICGAADFQCNHIPGRTYGEHLCARVKTRVLELREISMTPHPDYPETYVMHVGQPRAEIELETGKRIARGSRRYNRHCQFCDGVPSPEDLDPTLWSAATDKKGE
jgi:hypothetical protein